MNCLRRLFGNPYAGMSAKQIYAGINSDHHAYLKRHGLTGPSPNNMGTPENPYGSLALSKEYQDFIARRWK